MRHTASTQANIPWRHEASKEDRLFAEEYVRRCTHLEQVYSERCREVEACGRALREVRDENRALRATIENLRRRRDPEEIVVATSRGQRFHLPTCGHVRDSICKEVHTLPRLYRANRLEGAGVLWLLLSLGLLWLLWLLLRPPCVEPARAAFNCKLWLLLWRWWWWFGQ